MDVVFQQQQKKNWTNAIKYLLNNGFDVIEDETIKPGYIEEYKGVTIGSDLPFGREKRCGQKYSMDVKILDIWYSKRMETGDFEIYNRENCLRMIKKHVDAFT